jgi:transposase InsO family protein
MAKGFLYLVVVMDWISRSVLAWRLSNTLGADVCVEALQEALSRYGRSEIFNTDQGSQFTSDDFTGTLKDHGIPISMDGKGRCMDNIFVERMWRSLKYEGSTSTPMRWSPRPKLALALGLASTMRSASTEPRLSHAAANLPGRPMDMWRIGFADRLGFLRLPSELGKRGNARLRPHTHRRHGQKSI